MTVSKADILFEHESDCLIVRAISRFFLIQKEEAIQAIADAITARPVKAALVDLRGIPGAVTFTDRYQLGELTGRYLAGTPIAVVVHEEQADPERIGKLVARNRGANVEVFTELTDAQAWLQKYLTPGV